MVSRRGECANNGRNTSRPYSLKLRVESLESRLLLAGGVVSQEMTPHVAAPNAFEVGAFSPEFVIERAAAQPYVAGMLTVAKRFEDAEGATDFGGRAAEWASQFDVGYWQTLFPAYELRSATNALNYPVESGEHLVIVDLEFDPSYDVAQMVRELANTENVLWSSPIFQYDLATHGDPRESSDDPLVNDQYHHAVMQNDLAWDITYGDSSVIVAVTDDGVSSSHPDLVENLWVNAGEIPGDGIDNDGNGFVDDVGGWDFVDGDANTNPGGVDSHGTHVAGIVAGRTNNAIGVAGTAGRSTAMPIRFYSDDNPTAWTSQVVRDALIYAVDNGAQIINTSYNLDVWVGDPNVTAALQYVHDRGVLHFNSAGNAGQANPARQAFTQSLLVANTNANDRLASTSNYGTGIDLAAPGTGVLSTVPGGTYSSFSGTSMAAPNAAGAAALIWAENPTWNSYQVAFQLLGSADSIDDGNPAFVGMLGAGRVNSFNALTGAPNPVTIESVVGLPEDGATHHDPKSTEFSIQFSNVIDFEAANSLENYELRHAGFDGVLDTADDETYALNQLSEYRLAAGEVRFDLADVDFEPGLHRLRVDANGLVDPFGNPVDGDNDGLPQGDFELTFQVSNAMERVGALPSFVSETNPRRAALRSNEEKDAFPVIAEAGQTVAVVVTPDRSDAKIDLQLLDANNVTLATALGEPGQAIVLPTTAVTEDGEYSVVVTSALATAYEYRIVKNANIDGLSESPQPMPIDDSRIELAQSARYAAIGHSMGSSAEPFHSRFNDENLFMDISATGTPLTLSGDGVATIQTSVGNSLLPAGEVSVSNDGVILGAPGTVASNNAQIPNPRWQRALAPLWDDFAATSGAVYWQEVFNGATNVLVVQWSDRTHEIFAGSATFQVQLFETGATLARFAYQDVDFGATQGNAGGSATIGYQWSTTGGIQISQNHSSITSGDVINITESASFADVDQFSIDLSSGSLPVLDVGLRAERLGDYGNIEMDLLDPDGEVVATGGRLDSKKANFDSLISGYEVDEPGVYTLVVRSRFSGEYALTLASDLTLDIEPNDAASLLLPELGDPARVMGYLGNSDAVWTQYSNPGAFIDISRTGTPLGLTDDGSVAVNLPFSNPLLNAGDYSISNNGILVGGSQIISGNNHGLPSPEFDVALAPYWDDLDATAGEVYWELMSIGGVDAMIVQWDQRPHFSVGDAATFQVQIYASSVLPVRYAYKDVRFGNNAFDAGSSATIGLQSASNDGVMFSEGRAILADGDVIDIVGSDRDIFRFDGVASQPVILESTTPFASTMSADTLALDPGLRVFDEDGVQLNGQVILAADGRNETLIVTPPVDGVYFVEVSSQLGGGEYLLRQVVPDGDFNHDVQFDCRDVDALVQQIARDDYRSDMDLTQDGVLDGDDLDEWLWIAGIENGRSAAYLSGDANLDGFVDGSDFNIWNQNKFSSVVGWCQGDFNADGVADGSDYNTWNENKFQANDNVVSSSTPSVGTQTTFISPMEVVDVSWGFQLDAGRRHDHIDSIFADFETAIGHGQSTDGWRDDETRTSSQVLLRPHDLSARDGEDLFSILAVSWPRI